MGTRGARTSLAHTFAFASGGGTAKADANTPQSICIRLCDHAIRCRSASQRGAMAHAASACRSAAARPIEAGGDRGRGSCAVEGVGGESRAIVPGRAKGSDVHGRHTFAFFPEHEPEQWWQDHSAGTSVFRNVGRRFARRLPQFGQHAARAQRGAAEGNRDSARTRRKSRADRAAIARRRFRPRAGRRSRRAAPWSLVVRPARGVIGKETADRHGVAKRSERAGPHGDIHLLSGRDACLCPWAGIEVVEIRGHRRSERARGRRRGR